MADTVKLKTGETMVCKIIDSPNDEDVPQLRRLLVHKDDIWQHHLDAWMSGPAKRLDTCFCVGAIDGELVSNVMTVMHEGIGLMGHVFTLPEHRRKGACDALMDMHISEFEERGGKAVYLGTGFESPPYRIYARHGYQAVPDRPGSMWWSPTYDEIEALYEDVYSDLDRASVTDAAWRHWPSMNMFAHLPLDRMKQTVRNAAHGLFGVCQAEYGFLSILQADSGDDSVVTRVLETRDGHVAGLASLGPDRHWGAAGATYVFDVCLPLAAAGEANELFEEFDWPEAHVLSYVADTDQEHIDILSAAGFRPHTHVERFFDGGAGLVVMDRG